MSTMGWIVLALAVAWLGARALGQGRGQASKWVDTPEGGAWVQCDKLPLPGQQVRCLGHAGGRNRAFNPTLAEHGVLRREEGGFTWNSSGRRSYLVR